MIEKKVYHIKIKFIEPVLGSQPGKASLVERYIRSKLHNEIEKLERKIQKTKDYDERKILEEKLALLQRDADEESPQVEAEDRLTVFPRSPEGFICLLNYQILGFFKEVANNYLEAGMKNKFSRYADVRASLNGNYRFCLFIREGRTLTEPDMILERPLRAFAGGQYIVSITASEVLQPPIEVEFYLVILGPAQKHNITEKLIKTCLEIGREKGGISQWRNAGFGKFETIHFTKI